MFEIGKKQTLCVSRLVTFGVYLREQTQGTDEVLLPGKEVPAGIKPGDSIEVFLYRDSKDRLIATTRTPLLSLGETAVLKVKDTGKIGAFLDWGLEKDLFLPFREQTKPVHKGEECLVALYVDKSKRLCATMKVYRYLRTDSPYHKDDHVQGRVYEISGNFGIFVAVDDCFSGLVPKKDAAAELPVGAVMQFRVAGVKPDGKLDLSVREKIPVQMEKDAEEIMAVLEEFDGVLPFDDHASPETIRREFSFSKNAFKRAVGKLLKEGRIRIEDGHIKEV